jgi:hypothetical protein
METFVIVFTIASGWIAFLVHKGNKVVKRQQELIDQLAARDGTTIERISCVSYHGGFPEIPTPQKVNISLSDGYLVLATNKGEFGKIPFSSWKKIESFASLRKHDPKDRSMVLFGPFNNLLFKDTMRHFIVINHEDSMGQDNNLLIEHKDPKICEEIFRRLDSGFRTFKLRGAGDTAGIQSPSSESRDHD